MGSMLITWGRLLLAVSAAAGVVKAQAPPNVVASLDYGTFKGSYSAKFNITYWAKIPFAAPPVGNNRFRAPQPPQRIEGVYDSNQSFDMCPQRTTNGSEDCLYLSVYSRPFHAPSQALRPIVVVFHGGGFIRGSAGPFTLPPSAFPVLNVSSATDLVFVYPNHRLNVFGFLPGRALAAAPDADLNPGLLDQAAAVRWAARHGPAFGGDPDRIALWGQSAGGGSVLAHTIAVYPSSLPHPPPSPAVAARRPFRRALASSPFWPRTYAAAGPEAQRLYDTVAARVGCAAAGSDAAGLACLRAADVQALRDAAAAVAEATTYTTSSYGWAAVVDGVFLPRPLSEATAPLHSGGGGGDGGGGNDGPDAVLAVYNTHEGENFVPAGLGRSSSSSSGGGDGFDGGAPAFGRWLRGFLPGLAADDVAAVEAAYPAAGGGGNETLGRYSDGFTRAGLIYRDAVLACPAYWAAGAVGAGRGWLAEYSMSPSKHASDTSWWNTVNAVQKTDPLHYRGFTGAFASFFMTGDPNALKLTDAAVPGAPPLSSGKAFNINAAGFANIGVALLEQRCALWRKLAPKIPV